MVYKAVHIVLNRGEDADLIYGLLSGFDFEGFEEQEKRLTGYIATAKMPAMAELDAVLKDFSYQVEVVPDQNWNAEWESHFQPVLVEEFCGIRADFHPPFQRVQYEIIINPRMSFGTGHHATTRLMIRLMQPLEMKNKKVLDFGTGTGILAVLAGKMGAEKIVAVDNDPNAVENAAQNIQENFSSGITLYCQDHPDPGEGSFDIILANINRNTLLGAAHELTRVLKRDGYLLLSGFLKEDQQAVETLFGHGRLTTDAVLEEAGWVAIRMHSS